MRSFITPVAVFGLMVPAVAGEPPKTNSSLPVAEELLAQEPYRFNGVVLTDTGRGSGFVAEDPRLFFTAAHVVFDADAWTAPPSWVGGYHAETEPSLDDQVPSRGYFRWTQYANLVATYGPNSRSAFSRDVALAWGYEPFLDGAPATLDFKGSAKLRGSVTSMITGYPAELDYSGDPGGFFLHATAPDTVPYQAGLLPYVFATHLSTGPGNSGGPVWIEDAPGSWKAAGVLVSGRPSETGVYGMSPSVQSLLAAARPVLATPRRSMKFVRGVSATSTVLAMAKPKSIPDGAKRWTRIPLSVLSFPEDSKVGTVRLSLDISTAHRGDLVVAILAPGGVLSIIHNGEGAGEDDLVFEDEDLSQFFAGGVPNGRWQLLVQDRISGDPAVVRRFELELTAE